jgi:hypothetical protein
MMTKYVHIVYVHPLELGLPNLHKVKAEREFPTEQEAKAWAEYYNTLGKNMRKQGADLPYQKAVYYGCVNDATGELV